MEGAGAMATYVSRSTLPALLRCRGSKGLRVSNSSGLLLARETGPLSQRVLQSPQRTSLFSRSPHCIHNPNYGMYREEKGE